MDDIIAQTVQKMLNGDNLALAKLVSLAENDSESLPGVMQSIFPHTGKAHRIGITGPPGVGKSTIINRLTAVIRRQNQTVAVIAVDPTSPYTGGAILGDRIRMRQHFMDDGVFIRSVATRGIMGGLSGSITEIISIIDASGKGYILVETVGVGQSESEVVNCADTVVVVLSPDSGDSIQLMKAGLLETADIFVVNKSDLPGAERFVNNLHMMLEYTTKKAGWDIPVVVTQAEQGVGFEELGSQIALHYQSLIATGLLNERRGQQRLQHFERVLEQRIYKEVKSAITGQEGMNRLTEKVKNGEVDPYAASLTILKQGALPPWLQVII